MDRSEVDSPSNKSKAILHGEMNTDLEDIITDMETNLNSILSDSESYSEDRRELVQLKTKVKLSTEN